MDPRHPDLRESTNRKGDDPSSMWRISQLDCGGTNPKMKAHMSSQLLKDTDPTFFIRPAFNSVL